MKTSVYKYPIPLRDDVRVELPIGAEILHVGYQQLAAQTLPMLWARVRVFDTNPENTPRKTVLLHWRGTGHAFRGNEGKHLGTIQIGKPNYELVFHLFEHIEP